MTLRIAKIEEPYQKRRVALEKSVATMSVELDHPDPEVLGIPGLVQQMIGRFSCKELDGMISGYSHSTRTTMKNGPTASRQERSLALPDSAPQGNSLMQITRFQPCCEETGQKESFHIKSSDLHCSKVSSKTKVNQYNLGVENIAIDESAVATSNSDSKKKLSRTVSAGVTVDSSNKKAPPLPPKSHKVQNLFKRQPKNSDSTLNRFRGQTNSLDHSETKEVNNCSSYSVPNCTSGSVELSGSKINQNNEFSNGQGHAIQSVNDSNDSLTETKKCNRNGGQDDSQETNNSHQKPTEKDGCYFLHVMSEVECELIKHCRQLEQLPEPITDEASGKIRAAIGKANLLVTKKFKQFHELCRKNVVNSADEPFQTTSEDLTGFWDLIQLQVDDVHRLFAEIYRLRENNWMDADPEETPQLAKVIEVKPRYQHVKSLPRKANPSRTPDISKAREEARKRLLAAKIAGRQCKALETEEDIQIFIS